jgi:hypothetical protein
VTFNPSIGVSDFKKLREERLTYVDKTRLVIDLIDRPGLEVVWFPRPRRFGKTLNLSMLRYFFERSPEDRTALFEGLEVFEAGPRYREHFGRYPVVFMSFRDAWAAIQRKIREIYIEHRAVLDSSTVSSFHRADYEAVLDGTATRTSYERALGDLTKLLHEAHGERAVVLIDEYDEPIHAAHVHGYGREMLGFFRAFLTTGLKDNSHIERGVLTGILRVAKESIFSGLNNLTVLSLLDPRFAGAFGFTEPEVARLLTLAGHTDRAQEVHDWYQGYRFGNETIYNPWSVLQFLSAPERGPQPYWLSTSGNELVQQALRRCGAVSSSTLTPEQGHGGGWVRSTTRGGPPMRRAASSGHGRRSSARDLRDAAVASLVPRLAARGVAARGVPAGGAGHLRANPAGRRWPAHRLRGVQRRAGRARGVGHLRDPERPGSLLRAVRGAGLLERCRLYLATVRSLRRRRERSGRSGLHLQLRLRVRCRLRPRLGVRLRRLGRGAPRRLDLCAGVVHLGIGLRRRALPAGVDARLVQPTVPHRVHHPRRLLRERVRLRGARRLLPAERRLVLRAIRLRLAAARIGEGARRARRRLRARGGSPPGTRHAPSDGRRSGSARAAPIVASSVLSFGPRSRPSRSSYTSG